MDMRLAALPLDPGSLRGPSASKLTRHQLKRCAGAVQRLNAIRTELASLDFTATPGDLLKRIKREELAASNSALLHALGLGSLGGDGVSMDPAMRLAIDANFGSFVRWRDEFVACAKALRGGSSWVLLVFQPREGTLVNQCADDSTQVLAGGVPILALDLDALADQTDFGADPGVSVDSLMDSIAWSGVHARYQHAVHAASEPLGVMAADVPDPLLDADDAPGGAMLLDVRRAGVFTQAPTMIAGARWRDPALVEAWHAALPAGRALLVYCVHGHEVSRATALRLRAAGLDARYLRGGIDGWQATGRPVVRRP